MVETAKMLRFLLVCGILSSLVYVGTDILAGMLWEGYSFVSQSVSELSAVGAPTRTLVVPLYLAYDVLLIAFALGVWVLAGRNRAQRVTALMVIGNAVIALVVVIFFPIHLGEAMSTFPNTMNVILMGVSVLCYLLAMGFGAAAYKNWFRFYSIGTLLTYLVLAVFRLLTASQIPAGESVSLVGIQERTMIYGYLLWVLVLAIVLLRAKKEPS